MRKWIEGERIVKRGCRKVGVEGNCEVKTETEDLGGGGGGNRNLVDTLIPNREAGKEARCDSLIGHVPATINKIMYII